MNKTELLKKAVNLKNWKSLYSEYKELCNYIFFGVLTTVVSFITYYVFRFVFPDAESVPEWLRWVFGLTAVLGTESNTVLPVFLSWICSVTFAYVTNRIWVFESRAKGFVKICAECASFFGARVLTFFIDVLIMFLLVDLTAIYNPFYEFFAKCVSSVFVLVLNYIFSKLFVFRKRSNNQ